MPRFHFHLEDGEPVRDPQGVELDDARAAQAEAPLRFARLLMARREEIWNDRALKLTVTDERGLVLFELELTATVAPALSAARRTRP